MQYPLVYSYRPKYNLNTFLKPRVQAVTAFRTNAANKSNLQLTEKSRLSVDRTNMNDKRTSMEYSEELGTTINTNSTIIPLSAVQNKSAINVNHPSVGSNKVSEHEKYSQTNSNHLTTNYIVSNQLEQRHTCDNKERNNKNAVMSIIGNSTSNKSSELR